MDGMRDSSVPTRTSKPASSVAAVVVSVICYPAYVLMKRAVLDKENKGS